MKSRMHLVQVFLVCLIWIGFCFFLSGKSDTLSVSEDEISWFFHTEYFDLLRTGRFDDPAWQSYEAYDHPPLAKYAFGLWVYLADTSVPDTRAALREQIGRWEFYGNTAFTPERYPELIRYVRLLRTLQVVLAGTTLVIFAVIGYICSRRLWVLLTLPWLMVLNPLFPETMLRVTPDALLLLLAGAGTVWYISLPAYRYRRIVGFGVLMGLAVSTKLTAVSMIAGYLTYQILRPFFQGAPIRRVMVDISVFLACVSLIWLISNPTVTDNWRLSARYLEFRQDQTVRLQEAYPKYALTSVPQRVQAVVCTFLLSCRGDYPNGRLFLPPVVVALLMGCGGLLCVRRVLGGEKSADWFIACLGSQVTVFTLAYLPLAFDRYFLPLLPLLSGLCSAGLLVVAEPVGRALREYATVPGSKRDQVQPPK